MTKKTELPQIKMMTIESLVKGMVHNSRMEINDKALAEMAASTKEDGPYHLPVVCNVEGFDHLCVGTGVMRILASKLNGETSIPVRVWAKTLTMAQLKAMNLSENVIRSRPTNDEMAPMILDMKKSGMTPAEISTSTGLKGNQVATMLHHNSRTPQKYRGKVKNTSIGETVEKGEISGQIVKLINAAYKGGSQPGAVSASERDEVYDIVVDNRLDLTAAREFINALKKLPRGEENRINDAYAWSKKHRELKLPITALKKDIEDAGGERQYLEMAAEVYGDIAI